jgi:hypothetical protein
MNIMRGKCIFCERQTWWGIEHPQRFEVCEFIFYLLPISSAFVKTVSISSLINISKLMKIVLESNFRPCYL